MTSQGHFSTPEPTPQGVPATAGPVYQQNGVWYAQGDTYAKHPAAMRIFNVGKEHTGALYPHQHQYQAIIAYRRLHSLLPQENDRVKWTTIHHTLGGTCVPFVRFGTMISTRGSYGIVKTDSGTFVSVRLDKLMVVEPIKQEGA